MISLFLALLLAGQEEPIDKLVEGWKQDNADARESATKEILRRWKSWKDVDLAVLRALEKGTDRESASRATHALRAIRVRREFGEAASAKIEKAEALLEDQRISGAPAQIFGWAKPGGPMFDLSPQVKQLIELGPEIEPFLRLRLSDPALRNE